MILFSINFYYLYNIKLLLLIILSYNFIFYFYYFIFLLILLLLLIIISTAFLTLFERKKISTVQLRKGPNKVGLLGLLQPFVDALKLLFKEFIIVKNSIFYLFVLSPFLSVLFGFSNWIIVPFMNLFSIISDINLSLFFFFSLSSLHVYSIVLAGWSSYSRYSFLGSIRTSTQLIAYDITLSIIVLNIFLFVKSFNLLNIMVVQYKIGFFLYYQFFLLILFFICLLAETNRHPFDLPEAESELVSGYNVEYSSINFAFFFLSEYTNMLIMSILLVNIFWGGWLFSYYYIKIIFIIILFFLIRALLPRYRYDQLLNIGWKVILPLSLFLFIWNFCWLFILDFFYINFSTWSKIIIYV